MKPALLIGGTFLFWIAARGRFSKYAALVHKSGEGSNSEAAAPATASDPLGAVAGEVSNIFNHVWQAIKKNG